jgi:hypothetical protein
MFRGFQMEVLELIHLRLVFDIWVFWVQIIERALVGSVQKCHSLAQSCCIFSLLLLVHFR